MKTHLFTFALIYLVSTLTFGQKFERVSIKNKPNDLSVDKFRVTQTYDLGNGLLWIVGWDTASRVGIYNSLKDSFIGKSNSELEGYYINQGFFKQKNHWFIISEFGEEDGIWEIKVHEFSNGKLDYKGSISLATVKKDSTLGDIFVFPIDNISIDKNGNEIILKFSNDEYVFNPRSKDEKRFVGKLEFSISSNKIKQK